MNEFHVYSKHRSIYSDVIQHSEAVLDIFVNTLEHDNSFDLTHLILKHARSCESDTCPVQSRYVGLFPIIITKATSYLKKPHELPYSLLICMIDLVKNDVSQIPIKTLQQFIQIGCALWTHEKIYQCRKSMELCIRVIAIVSDYDIVLGQIIKYIQLCREHITEQDIDRFKSIEYTEFFHHSQQKFTFDRVTLKLLIELVLSTLSKQGLNANYITAIQHEITDLHRSYTSKEVTELLFSIYCVNDDDTIHLLHIVLSIYQQGQPQCIKLLDTLHINPHSLFLYFLHQCGDTHDILIDLLLENDSDFLAYFHRYIIYATTHIIDFKNELDNNLDTIQTIIANTCLVLDGEGFPYNTKPLLVRLVKFEETLYL